MFLHHEIRKSSVGVVNRKNLSGFCIRGGDLSGFCTPYISHCQISFFTVIEEEGMTIFPENLSGFCIRGGDLSGFCIPPKKHLSGFCTPLSGFCIRSYLYLGSGNLNPPLSIIFASLRLLTEGPPFSFPSENRKKQEKTGFQKKNGDL